MIPRVLLSEVLGTKIPLPLPRNRRRRRHCSCSDAFAREGSSEGAIDRQNAILFREEKRWGCRFFRRRTSTTTILAVFRVRCRSLSRPPRRLGGKERESLFVPLAWIRKRGATTTTTKMVAASDLRRLPIGGLPLHRFLERRRSTRLPERRRVLFGNADGVSSERSRNMLLLLFLLFSHFAPFSYQPGSLLW